MNGTSPQKLVFVYNADSGIRNTAIDGMHKILGPNTDNCSLCALTFGAFTENGRWKKFRKTTPLPMDFLHKDEFKRHYASKFAHRFTYPIVLAVTKTGFEVFIGTVELAKMGRAEELIALVNERMEV